jgi:hypothetical protein
LIFADMTLSSVSSVWLRTCPEALQRPCRRAAVIVVDRDSRRANSSAIVVN